MALSTKNIAAQPTSTFLGLSALATSMSHYVATASLPTSPVGWVSMGLGLLGGLFGILGGDGVP